MWNTIRTLSTSYSINSNLLASLSTTDCRDKYVSLAERSLSNFAGRDIDGGSLLVRDVSSRSLDTAGEQTLVRRKSIAAKIRGAFKVSQTPLGGA